MRRRRRYLVTRNGHRRIDLWSVWLSYSVTNWLEPLNFLSAQFPPDRNQVIGRIKLPDSCATNEMSVEWRQLMEEIFKKKSKMSWRSTKCKKFSSKNTGPGSNQSRGLAMGADLWGGRFNQRRIVRCGVECGRRCSFAFGRNHWHGQPLALKTGNESMVSSSASWTEYNTHGCF